MRGVSMEALNSNEHFTITKNEVKEQETYVVTSVRFETLRRICNQERLFYYFSADLATSFFSSTESFNLKTSSAAL